MKKNSFDFAVNQTRPCADPEKRRVFVLVMECDGKWCQLFLLLLFFVRKETKEPSCDGFPVWPSIHRSWMAPPCNAAPHCASHKVGGLWRVSSHNFSSSSFIFFFFYSNIPFLLAAFRWNFQCHSNRPSIKTNLNRPGKARDSTINTRCRDFHQNLLARNFIFIFKKNNYRFIDYFFIDAFLTHQVIADANFKVF